jgi:hypothetical protein
VSCATVHCLELSVRLRGRFLSPGPLTPRPNWSQLGLARDAKAGLPFSLNGDVLIEQPSGMVISDIIPLQYCLFIPCITVAIQGQMAYLTGVVDAGDQRYTQPGRGDARRAEGVC